MKLVEKIEKNGFLIKFLWFFHICIIGPTLLTGGSLVTSPVCPTVCPSVCLSVTRVLKIPTIRFLFFFASSKPITRSAVYRCSEKKCDGPNVGQTGPKCRFIAIIWRLLHQISLISHINYKSMISNWCWWLNTQKANLVKIEAGSGGFSCQQFCRSHFGSVSKSFLSPNSFSWLFT